ncbi:hypothetical protein [Amycolatopsis tolypomycina]|uniref:hypothetical protein n=1 Tax=Amycolatopsis tolypomycina TaxID=208445 RepID=UPI001FC91DAB|nr:hypothetical protein [Amycolatopsis tolypomycina]
MNPESTISWIAARSSGRSGPAAATGATTPASSVTASAVTPTRRNTRALFTLLMFRTSRSSSLAVTTTTVTERADAKKTSR